MGTDVIALVTWLVTAVLGFTMLSIWIGRGGLRAARAGGATATRFAPGMVFGHFLLAAAGLILWIVFLVAGGTLLAWISFADLVVVAVLGDVLFLRWWKGPSDTVEARFPKPVVYGHGLFAVATVVLVLLAALGVGA